MVDPMTAAGTRGAAGGGEVMRHVLRRLLDRRDVLVIDVETTGLDARAEVLAVAVIDTTGRALLDAVSWPQGQIPSDASAVHGLTRARLRSMGARPWPEVHVEVADLLRHAAAVIAWNADYDRRLLHQTAERYGLRLPSMLWCCAMEAEATTRSTVGDRAAWIKRPARCTPPDRSVCATRSRHTAPVAGPLQS